MTLTDASAATDDASPNDASPDEINNAPHAPNATTSWDVAAATAENKTSARQLLDG